MKSLAIVVLVLSLISMIVTGCVTKDIESDDLMEKLTPGTEMSMK